MKLPKKTVKNDPSVIMSSFRVHDSRSLLLDGCRTDDIEDFVRQGGFDRCPTGFNGFNLLVMGGTNPGKDHGKIQWLVGGEWWPSLLILPYELGISNHPLIDESSYCSEGWLETTNQMGEQWD